MILYSLYWLSILANLRTIWSAIECDFDKLLNGCESKYGLVCNQSNNECECVGESHINVGNYCLPARNVGESCYTSQQCLQLPRANIGCYLDDRELDSALFKSWLNTESQFQISGLCSCQPGYYVHRNACVAKKLYNENCSASEECTTPNAYCDHFGKQCKCKPTFRYSVRRDRCVSQLVGESCSHTDQCLAQDRNAECRVGSCQCKTGYVLSNSDKCVIVRVRGTSHHILMMLVVIGTAIVFALLSTAHKKWSSAANSLGARSQPTGGAADCSYPSRASNVVNYQHSNHLPLTAPSFAVIWPLRPQTDTRISHIYPEEGPPSYAEAIAQSANSDIITINSVSANNSNNNNNNSEIVAANIDNNNSTSIKH